MSGNINFNGWINDDGSENYKCRAWVNFNGEGTVAIRASGNVSSITDNGTGQFRVNLTTSLPDTNYSIAVNTSAGTANAARNRLVNAAPLNASSFNVVTSLPGDASVFDNAFVNASVFR